MTDARRQELAEALLELGARVDWVLRGLGACAWEHGPERRALVAVAARLQLLGLELAEEPASSTQEVVR